MNTEKDNQGQLARLRRWGPLLLTASLLLGGLLTFVTYPGIWYTDSVQRAKIAAQLASGIDPAQIGSFLSLLPQLVISLCLRVSGSYACYTWLQAAFFYAVAFGSICWFFRRKAALVLGVLFAVCPLFLGFAIYWETGTVTAACLLLLAVVTDCACPAARPLRNKVLGIILLLAGSFLAVGYRLNTATAVAGFVLWELVRAVRCRAERRERSLRVAALVLGTVLAMQVPKIVGVQPINNGIVGPMWETACMLNRIGPGQGYDTYLDDLIGEGNTQKIFQVTEAPEDSMYLFSDAMDYWSLPWSPAKSRQFAQRYLELIGREPGTFLRVKGEMVRHTLGQLPLLEYEYNRDGQMEAYQFSDTPQRHTFYDTVTGFVESWRWARTPWQVFLTALVLLAVGLWLKTPVLAPARLVFLAACYEGAFFLTTQSHEVRYWFPALVLLLFAIALSLTELLPVVLRRIRKGPRSGKDLA